MSASVPTPVTTPDSEKTSKHRTPPGHRVLHLVIDQATFDHLHIQAIHSRMKFTAYMTRFLQEAFPYSDPATPPPASQSSLTSPPNQ
jgi:hypothetical protein